MTSMKKLGNITEEVKRYRCLYNKADNNYEHQDVKKDLWTAIGKKLVVERKSAKVDLKKLLSKRRINTKQVLNK